MNTPELETERLYLRKIHTDDVKEIFDCWMRDEDVSRYMWWRASDDIKETKAFVEFELNNLENSNWNRWIIVLKNTNEIIGTCLIFYNEDEKHWDISYNLGKNFWGRGYATEAMRAVVKYAAEVMQIEEIYTSYAIENRASEHVLEKMGFQFIKEIPYECNGGDIVTTGRYCRLKVSGEKIEIKLGNIGDIDSWMELIKKVKDDFPGLETEESMNEHRTTVLAFMGNESAICAKSNNKIVGTLLFSKENHMLCFLAVDIEYRRQHIAEKMVTYMFSMMDLGVDVLVTTYRQGVPEGIAARAFYKRMGFVEGRLTEEFGSPVQEFILKR